MIPWWSVAVLLAGLVVGVVLASALHRRAATRRARFAANREMLRLRDVELLRQHGMDVPPHLAKPVGPPPAGGFVVDETPPATTSRS